jgi:tRNA(fMet)-specific endonuclease VapC
MYLLDTNHCIFLINRRYPGVSRRLARHVVGSVAVSSITVSELWYGVQNSSRKEQNQAALAKFLLPLEVLPYDERAAQTYGKIRPVLERAGSPIGAMDLLIAAHALSLPGILVTHNQREFERVPGLKVEDWTEEG